MQNKKQFSKRLTALLLCAALLLGAFPFFPSPQAAAASWSAPYVEKLQTWGVMLGDPDGNMHENRATTRAEMAAMLNRAFGYTRKASIPFTDVKPEHWFYEDICTGFAEGIFTGTSPTTASPNRSVTREQALTFIGRCLRLEESPGEITEFTDGRTFNSWSAPYVRSALLSGIISGMSDGSFQPKRNITRGEVAKMLSVAIGTLIDKPGTYTENGVFGNVTINSSGVTLRDTTIAGDLYLTGGVGLGDVVLDNVRVLGRIVIAGGGESQDGMASITLNNVEAHKLLVDPATGQYVSVRAIGATKIPETYVQSNAFLRDDVRDPSNGLQTVYLNGENGAQFTIAGNMKNVVNQTPGSTLTVGDTGTGSVGSIRVDELATGSHLKLEINANVDNIYLDTATDVTGSGDIGKLTVSTNGSSCEILPNEVEVRPGVTTDIADEGVVDSEIAKEISSKPQLLEGYPKARNVAPTTADGVFSTNKAGTLYWALTTAAIGPLNNSNADDLITPSDYGSGFLSYGSMKVPTSKTEVTAKLSGLTAGGTYYLSAILVDSHGWRSPVKAQEIKTPDGTVPAMSAGFPTIADRTPTRTKANADTPYFELVDIQATVMANKSCDLYYVLLNQGSTPPQTNEFLSHSFVDPLGYGRLHLVKNTMDTFKINEVDLNLDGVAETLGELEEKKTYDLYLWLTDADGVVSSKVIKQSVTTKDITPPEFLQEPMPQTAAQATSVRLSNSINEDGIVYWVAVPRGTVYPKPNDGSDATSEEFLSSEYAKLQVINAMGVPKEGKSGRTNAKANTDFNINISGLARETGYDVYYVAVDTAGNYSDPVKHATVYTLDQSAPIPTQQFEHTPEENPDTPYSDSTINIIFNEDIRYNRPSGSNLPVYKEPNLLKLYQNSKSSDEAMKLYTDALRDMFTLYEGRNPVAERTSPDSTDDWTIDYRNVRVVQDGKNTVVSFYNDPSNPAASSLNLQSGASYYFQLKNIADESTQHNVMRPTSLPAFTVVSAEAILSTPDTNDVTMQAYETGEDGELAIDDEHQVTYIDSSGNESSQIPMDMYFTIEPRSTRNSADGINWDLLLWFDVTCDFQLFTRVKGTEYWTPVGGKQQTLHVMKSTSSSMGGVSVFDEITKLNGSSTALNPFSPINGDYKTGGAYCGLPDGGPIYEYGIYLTSLNGNSDRTTFSDLVTGRVTVVTGSSSNLLDLARRKNLSDIDNNQRGITNISKPNVFEISRQFEDRRAPNFTTSYPRCIPTTDGVRMDVYVNRPGTLFYVISKADLTTGGSSIDLMPMEYNANNQLEPVAVEKLDNVQVATAERGPNGPTLTTAADVDPELHFDYPDVTTVINPITLANPNIKYPPSGIELKSVERVEINVDGLSPATDYFVYFVTKGVTDIYSDVLVYKFRTNDIIKPIITTNATNALANISSSQDATNIEYKLISYDNNMRPFLKQPFANTAGNIAPEDQAAFNEFKATHKSTLKMKGTGPNATPMEFDDPEFTVLDALLENIMASGKSTGSLFDFFASQQLKDQVIEYIRSSGGDTASVGRDSGFIDKSSVPLPVQCDTKWPQMKANVDYCMIVFGYCGDGTSQSNFAFSGAQPIALPKETIKASWDANSLICTKDSTTNKPVINGTFILYFSDFLNYYDRSENPPQRIPLYATNQAPNENSIATYLTYPATVKPDFAANDTTVPMNSLTFDFENSSSPVSIRLSGYFAGPNSDPQTTGLTLTIRPERTLTDDPGDSCGVTVTISPSAWDSSR